jgi:hypothetical protein
MQLTGLFLSFVIILVLAGRRVELGTSLLLGTVVLALASKMPPPELAVSAAAGLLDPRTVELIASVAVITSLADVLRRFGLLETMVVSVTQLLGGARAAIMAVPSLIGALPVVGGAILSAPMVDGLGQRLSLSPARKAAVNMVFRHAWYFIAPFTPSLVMASQMAGVSLGALILWQMPFALVMLIGGYLFLLRATAAAATSGETAAAADPAPVPAGQAGGSALSSFLRSSSPILAGVVLSLGIGPMSLPLWAGVGLGLVLALVLSRKHEGFHLLGLPAVLAGVQWKTIYAMGAVMIFSRVLTDSGAAEALIDRLIGSELPLWFLTLVVPAVIGFVVALPSVAVGISYPTLLPLVSPDRLLGASAVLYSAGFLAYFVSPIHLCQVLTSRFFGITPNQLYREYRLVLVLLAACMAGYVWMVFR